MVRATLASMTKKKKKIGEASFGKVERKLTPEQEAKNRENLRKRKEIESKEGFKKQRTGKDLPSIELKQEGKGAGKLEKVISVAQRPIVAATEGVEAAVAGQRKGSVGENVARSFGAGAVVGAGIGAAIPVKATAATFAGMQSTIGLSKFSGTAGNLVKGKFVSIPGQVTATTGKNAALVNAFASNAKSAGLTKKILIGAGFSLGAASLMKDLFGTYPFASFGKEETLQSISFVMNSALDAELYDEAEQILAASNEIVNATPTLADKVPYANVQKEFQRFVSQQRQNNEVWAKIIEERKGEIGQESDFAASQREASEEATQRKLEEQALDSEYFRLIREKKFDEAEELLQSRLKE